MADHALRTSPDAHPLLHAFLGMSMNERWLNRPPSEMLKTFHSFRGEAFELIVEDLLAVPSNQVVLAEGFRLLPRLVAPLLSGPRQAVWLIPSPEQRRSALQARGSLYEIAGKTSDPDRALDNLLTRDAMFSEEIDAEAMALHLPVIRIDVGDDIADVTQRVADALGLERPLRSSPPAHPV